MGTSDSLAGERGGEAFRATPASHAVFAIYWLIGAGFLICSPCAQVCAGLSRFVLLAGGAALYFAWPKAQGSGPALARGAACMPLLALALALDLQAGLSSERASGLALRGGLLCLACLPLGAVRSSIQGRIWVWLFGFWFLLPLALGLWLHVSAGASLAPGRVLSWSPVGWFWSNLPLRRDALSGWGELQCAALVVASLASLVWGRSPGEGT